MLIFYRPYGALARADIKRNFAFVEFRRVEDAIKVRVLQESCVLRSDVIAKALTPALF